MLTPALLAAATLLLRIPLLAPRLAHWDAVNYALGLHEFNVAAHQPHPPGSPYFIGVARAALAITGDDNSALIGVSLLASAGAVVGEYYLVKSMSGRSAGVVAATILMTQPVFWGYGTVGTAWTFLACLAVLIGIACLQLARCNTRHVIPSALILGCASGFRLDATVFLAPLWLWSLLRAEPRWRQRSLALAVVVASVLVWLVPVALSAGGFDTWLSRLLALLPSTDAAPGAFARQFAANTAIAFGTLAFTLGPLVVAGVIANRGLHVKFPLTRDRAIFWTLWIVPAFVFLWLVDSTEPGHDLVFVPAIIGFGVGLFAQNMRRMVMSGVLVLAFQVGVFVLAAPVYNRPLASTADSMLLNVTAPGWRQQQAALDAALTTIRARFRPDQAILLTLVSQDPYRFLMYYLPEYRVIRLDPVNRIVLTASGGRQGNWTPVADCLVSGVSHAVWVVSPPLEPGDVPQGAIRVSNAQDGPFQVWDLQIESSTPDYLGLTLGGSCAAG